ncbi:DNA-binding protein [Salipaludibacillus sp. CF4.18]|uniref:DNA-binding protein n=1 Tax=Salipaludibacillus sp. CF4.18 TaxID=3373081 RepID=UPI003EE5A2A1
MKEGNNLNGYVNLTEVIKLLGRSESSDKIRDLDLVKRIPNVKIKNTSTQTFYCLQDIQNFINNHISKEEIISLVNRSKQFIMNYIKKNNIKPYILVNSPSQIYYPREKIYTLFSEYIEKPLKFINNKEYIDIYKLASLVGRDANRLSDNNLIQKFAEYVLNIPNLKVVNENGRDYYCLDDVEMFLSDYISIKDSIHLLKVSLDSFDNLINDHSIKGIFLGKKKENLFYPRIDIEELVESTPYDTDIYISIYDISDNYFQKLPPNFIIELKSNLRKELKGHVTEIEITGKFQNVKSNRYIYTVYLKSEILKFFEGHISKKEVQKYLLELASHGVVRKVFKKFADMLTIHLGKNNNAIFYNEFDFKKLIEEVEIENKAIENRKKPIHKNGDRKYYSGVETKKILNLSEKIYKKIEGQELPIAYYQGHQPYFDSIDVDNFLNKLKAELEYINNDYYTVEQIKQKYNSKYLAVLKNKNNSLEIEYKELSIYLKNWLKSNGGHVFKKDKVDSYWESYFNKISLNEISMENPFEEFVYKVEEVLNLEFPNDLKNTKKLWYENVEKTLIKSNTTTISHLIHSFINTTESILSIFTKEIYYYKTAEINKKFLNPYNSISRIQQGQFYSFVRKVVDTFDLQNQPIQIVLDNLNNPSDYKTIYHRDSTSIYTVQEYHQFYNYCLQVDIHKAKALSDAKRYIEDSDKGLSRVRYKKYDSTWLYVLVQLTNNWRHNTVITQIPRIDLSNTRITSLNWLEKNEPSIEDANDIIFQIGRYVQHIHKTNVNSESAFNIGEPMKIAFATAIAICEMRTQLTNNNSEILIRLTLGKDPLSIRLNKNRYPYDAFFSEFTNDLVFENRKMNRTLNTLIWSVLRHLGKGLKESQVSRAHKNQQTTIDHYIKLDQDQVDHLVLELFERNSFGHVTQIFNKVLFGAEIDRINETENIINTHENFGDPIKIEATSGLINKLAKEREAVSDYLRKKDSDKVWNLYLNSIAGNLPSKERYYQCVYTECKYEDEYGQMPDCHSCGAAIVNVYALSQLMDVYVNLLDKIAKEFKVMPLGEKRKLANHFHLLYEVVSDARVTFGRKVLDGFIDGGEERLKSLGKLVSSYNLKKLLTIKDNRDMTK